MSPVCLRPLRIHLVDTLGIAGPYAVHLHLDDAPAVSAPVGKPRPVRMSAEADHIAFREFGTEMTAFLRMFRGAVEEPPAVLLVHREKRPVGNDECIPRAGSLRKQLLDLVIVRIVEIQDNVGIVPDIERECGLLNLLSEFLGHSPRHIVVICSLGVHPADIVVADNRDERQASELLLEPVHHIVQHLPVHRAIAAVTLDQVPHLECHCSIVIHKAGRPLQQPRASVAPHLPVSGELRPLNPVKPLHRLVVMGMIYRCRLGIEMRVTKDDDIVSP